MGGDNQYAFAPYQSNPPPSSPPPSNPYQPLLPASLPVYQPAYQQPIPVALTCVYHPGYQASHKCYNCGKLLCLQCSNELQRRRNSRIYCQDCYGGARSSRCMVSVGGLIVFLIVLGIVFGIVANHN